MTKIVQCPSCGNRGLKNVCRSVRRVIDGREVVVPKVRFQECPDCGEKIYDAEAMRQLESHGTKRRVSA